MNENKIFFSQCWDNNKQLGRYYNDFMRMLPDDGWGCLMDYDTMFLTNDYGKHLYKYIELFPDATLTCRTNRMHASNTNQQLAGIDRENHNINYHRQIAESRKKHLYEVTEAKDPRNVELIGGMLLLLSKKVWKESGGFSETGILDVDNEFHKRLIKLNKPVLIMQGVYIYHWYRHDGSKQHLL